jgi:hypothetical protein
MSRPFSISVLAAIMLFVACGPSADIKTVPATGMVTYKGKPVEGATISFIPDGPQRAATAISGPNGKYELTTLDQTGAMPGNYTVLVRKLDIPAASTAPVSMEEALKLNTRPPPAPKDLVPSKYSDPARTPLRFEVKAREANVFNIELTD